MNSRIECETSFRARRKAILFRKAKEYHPKVIIDYANIFDFVNFNNKCVKQYNHFNRIIINHQTTWVSLKNKQISRLSNEAIREIANEIRNWIE
jgi:hypothetical protein